MWIKTDVTLSRLWKTREFLHAMMANAIGPFVSVKTAVNRIFEDGKIQI
jgi:hypothetical protein